MSTSGLQPVVLRCGVTDDNAVSIESKNRIFRVVPRQTRETSVSLRAIAQWGLAILLATAMSVQVRNYCGWLAGRGPET
jgi:hypothetical protein